MIRLFTEKYDTIGQYLRLQVHDSLVSDVPIDKLEQAKADLIIEMTKPIKQLPLPASYNLGEYLVIDVDTKQGERWGSLA